MSTALAQQKQRNADPKAVAEAQKLPYKHAEEVLGLSY